jgi:hypothetical protein
MTFSFTVKCERIYLQFCLIYVIECVSEEGDELDLRRRKEQDIFEIFAFPMHKVHKTNG